MTNKFLFVATLCAHTSHATLRGLSTTTQAVPAAESNNAAPAADWSDWFGSSSNWGGNTNTVANFDITEGEWRACATSIQNAGSWPTLESMIESSGNGIASPTYDEAITMTLHPADLWGFNSNAQPSSSLTITGFLSSLPHEFSVKMVNKCKKIASSGHLAAMSARASSIWKVDSGPGQPFALTTAGKA